MLVLPNHWLEKPRQRMADRREATGHETVATSPDEEAYAGHGLSSAQIAEKPWAS
jgi:hypothetical protein